MEADKKRKEDRKQREKELMSGAILGGFATEGGDGVQTKRNFTVAKKQGDEADASLTEKKTGITPEQREENKVLKIIDHPKQI